MTTNSSISTNLADPGNDILYTLFLRQIYFECRAGRLAYSQLLGALAKAQRSEQGAAAATDLLAYRPKDCQDSVSDLVELHHAAASDVVPVWAAVQAFVTASANVSRTLWGRQERFTAERHALRRALGVAQTSPLRAMLWATNFNHVDDWLDDWWKETPDRNYVSVDALLNSATTPINEFQDLATTSMEVTFWGEKMALTAIHDEVVRIGPVALRESIRQPNSSLPHDRVPEKPFALVAAAEDTIVPARRRAFWYSLNAAREARHGFS